MALEYNIKEAGYEVLKAADGEQAFELVLAHNPEVIVSDITMPEMNGIELCRKIRSIGRFAEIPFIFLTAHGEPDERIRGLRSGADDYIVKPFDIDELIARIDILYGKIQRKNFSATLSGNFEELSLSDMLQVFAQTSKEGILLIKSEEKNGSISFKGDLIMDATFMDVVGEDALVQLLPLANGNFHFSPQEVVSGSIGRPINFVIFDVIRLIDEYCNLAEFIPNLDMPLNLTAEDPPDDSESTEIWQALQEGADTGREVQRSTGFSRTRTEVLLAELVRDGLIKPRGKTGSQARVMKHQSKPCKILFVFTDEAAATTFLENSARVFSSSNVHGIKAGMGSFLKVAVENVILHIFSLRGEKKFSFLWKSMLENSDAALFFVSTPGDVEHLSGFREQLLKVSGMPLFPITSDRRVSDGDSELVSGDAGIREFFLKIVDRIVA
jgi:DNA-binding response OmpR family regulator